MKKILKSFLLVFMVLSCFSSYVLANQQIKAVDRSDLTILGMPYNVRRVDIMESLGTPNEMGSRKGMFPYFARYGGVTFHFYSEECDSRVGAIIIKNKDAVTGRGIAVGDSLEKMLQLYGNPTQIVPTKMLVSKALNQYKKVTLYKYIWGTPRTDNVEGIEFSESNGTIYEISVWP